MVEDCPTDGENLAPAASKSWQSLLERARQLRMKAVEACLRSRELQEHFQELRAQIPARTEPDSARARRRPLDKR